MHFNLSLSWFLILIACVIMTARTWGYPKAPTINWEDLAFALFFAAFLFSGSVQMAATAH